MRKTNAKQKGKVKIMLGHYTLHTAYDETSAQKWVERNIAPSVRKMIKIVKD